LNPFAQNQSPVAPSNPKTISADNADGTDTSEISGARIK
jgi:hypothetical protein